MAWTDELKEQAVNMYKEADPTPETSTEIIKDIAEELEQSPNGVRMILIQAGVYVKKESGSGNTTKGATSKGEGSKRVSKEEQLNALRAAIVDLGAEVDDSILEKMTGKAAAYFVSVLQHTK